MMSPRAYTDDTHDYRGCYDVNHGLLLFSHVQHSYYQTQHEKPTTPDDHLHHAVVFS